MSPWISTTHRATGSQGPNQGSNMRPIGVLLNVFNPRNHISIPCHHLPWDSVKTQPFSAYISSFVRTSAQMFIYRWNFFIPKTRNPQWDHYTIFPQSLGSCILILSLHMKKYRLNYAIFRCNFKYKVIEL